MKKLGILTCLSLATCLMAHADDPSLTIQSGIAIINVALASQGNGIWGINSPISETLSNGTSFTLTQVTLDVDPTVHYAIGVTNADGATGYTPYTFTFTTPTTLAGGLYNVSSSLAGSLTAGGSTDVTLQPTATGTGYVQQAFIGSNDAGVDLLNTSVTPAWSPLSQPFGPYSASGTYNLATPVTQISVTTAFGLSNSDSASLSGRFDVNLVNSVPEPCGLPLAFVAAGAFVFLVARARRSQTPSSVSLKM